MDDILIVGDTEHSAELRHEVPVAIGDPFVYAEVGDRRVAVVWSIEGDRIAKVDPSIEIVPSESFPLREVLAEIDGDPYKAWPAVCVRYVRSLGLRRALVPSTFPTLIADVLRADGVELVVDPAHFADRRRVKSSVELAGVRAAQAAVDAALARVVDLLRRSESGDAGRSIDGEPLTCELLKSVATEVFGERGCRGDDLVVAHGPQAADGHDPGSGRIANDDVVLCDFFPQHVESACFADTTRTFAVGAVDDEIARWHADCVGALELALGMVRPGVDGRELNAAVCRFFEERGYATKLSAPDGETLRDGFFHGLGHGVGLRVHEAPSLGLVGHPLVAGDVIALEPGLYRHGYGGVRVEDLALVTEHGYELLTRFPYDLRP
jgi:Xaa-Pro aminopeptidase